MYENLKSASVYTPKSFSELKSIRLTCTNPVYWGGGTYLMTRGENPNPENPEEIISLEGIGELQKISRTDTTLEVGSMVTLDTFSSTCKTLFPKTVNDALESIATQIIRRQATIGGALCTDNIKTSLIAILYCMEAQVEVNHFKRKRLVSRWMSVSDLYDQNGNMTLAEGSLITKIRITMQKNKHYYFSSTNSPMLTPETTTIFGMCNLIQLNNLLSSRIILIYPQVGIHYANETTTQLANQFVPINPQRISKLTKNFKIGIKDHFSDLSELQIEQSKRLFEYYLYYLNRRYLKLLTVQKKA